MSHLKHVLFSLNHEPLKTSRGSLKPFVIIIVFFMLRHELHQMFEPLLT